LVSYERAAEEDPSSVWYWINQIEPMLALNRSEDALDVIDQALKISPQNDSAWARKGQILRRLNRHAEALDAYQRALDISPRYGWAWNGRGLAFIQGAGKMRWPVIYAPPKFRRVMCGSGTTGAMRLCS
jgi:tetratricopeptide (TPR) repeat protein